MQSRKQQRNKNYLRSSQYGSVNLRNDGWDKDWLKNTPEFSNTKALIMTANRTIKGKTKTITKTIKMATKTTASVAKPKKIERINNELMNIVENAGESSAPIVACKAKTNAAGKMINGAKVELAWNDRSGEKNKPDILK